MNEDAPHKTAADRVKAESKAATAWQPFTPRGVTAFAQAPASRVLLLKAVVAAISSIVVVWFLHACYAPSIAEAIQNLPDKTAFQDGKLTGIVSKVLTQKKFLSIVVDLEESGQSGQTSDVQIELRRDNFQACSLLGCGLFGYPDENLVIGRSTAEPWWGARKPVILALCGASTFAIVWLGWIGMSLFYAPVTMLVAYVNDRELSWRGSWRLASAAQMSGALLMSLVILLYGVQAFDLIQFIFFSALHFFVAWVYVFAAPFFLPPIPSVAIADPNPFDMT